MHIHFQQVKYTRTITQQRSLWSFVSTTYYSAECAVLGRAAVICYTHLIAPQLHSDDCF